jgi:hypothetical protein
VALIQNEANPMEMQKNAYNAIRDAYAVLFPKKEKPAHGMYAQSAMEYLMTYGWAILIIAVVLGALFQLGIFGAANVLGTACVASPGYLCQNPTLITTGKLTFSLGQSTGSSAYNIALACAETQMTNGLPNPGTSFYSITASGAAIAESNSGNTLVSGQELVVEGLPCYGSTGALLSSPSVGTSFSGYIWLNYTTNTGAAAAGTNPWRTSKIATVRVSVS